jgi:hypothetical protein
MIWIAISLIQITLAFLLGGVIALIYGFRLGWAEKTKSIYRRLAERERELEKDIATTNKIEDNALRLRQILALKEDNSAPMSIH